ncbi:YfiR family protein [Microbulbifer thermotolerans]|uniref:YfiR family protein n=1 Tax=Microbulbifer thermotolerans TaxID=252514 RepID=UPI00224B78C7|nr:YfiR family protein [Microbulbifer thermotolerans]MCX2781215.1 YfiR family protein [Microbulbifer thermotolerans]MCX2803756.1 YfiR family protein [Microbulbifer thermotolerans]
MSNRPHTNLLRSLVLLIAAMAVGVQASPPLSRSETGRKVMVDYITHFAHHLQWPIEVFSGAGAPFRICVMEANALRDPLVARLKHQSINGRRVLVEAVEPDALRRARACQIVVLGEMAREDLLKVIRALEFFPVLTVSDVERFAMIGGMIEFASNGENLTLQFNKTMLDRAELKMGDSLFRLSVEVN